MSPSNDPTTTVKATTSRAVKAPSVANATTAAKSVAIGAPMTGINAPNITTTASAGASGTLRITRPMPTSTPSQMAMRMMPRVYPERLPTCLAAVVNLGANVCRNPGHCPAPDFLAAVEEEEGAEHCNRGRSDEVCGTAEDIWNLLRDALALGGQPPLDVVDQTIDRRVVELERPGTQPFLDLRDALLCCSDHARCLIDDRLYNKPHDRKNHEQHQQQRQDRGQGVRHVLGESALDWPAECRDNH